MSKVLYITASGGIYSDETDTDSEHGASYIKFTWSIRRRTNFNRRHKY